MQCVRFTVNQNQEEIQCYMLNAIGIVVEGKEDTGRCSDLSPFSPTHKSSV